uniref:Retrotransposon gag domain-containing protein n=1 Tax=Cannabis sativa TaxID=3483 RepID=A0A803QSI5_CANSA
MQTLTQGSSDVTSYYTKLKGLWDLLQEYRPQPVCTCGALKIIQEYQDDNKVLEFLIFLNESYLNARSQILLQDPLPNVNKAYASIILEEKQRGIVVPQYENNQQTSDSTGQFASNAQANRGHNQSYNKGDKRPTCSHCGVPGHTIAKCYRINGYPPRHKSYGGFP